MEEMYRCDTYNERKCSLNCPAAIPHPHTYIVEAFTCYKDKKTLVRCEPIKKVKPNDIAEIDI